MKKDKPIPVVFRRFKDGEIIALFPTIPYTNNINLCSSFMHVGQHDAAGYSGVVNQTTPAAPHEYINLKRELESEPYNYVLKVCRRSCRAHFEERLKNMKAEQ